MDATTIRDRVIKRFLPPPKLKVSDWAEERRYLSPESSAEPGKWKNDRTAYLVGIMDATCESNVHEVVVMCSAQIGKTEAQSNILGRQIDIDPCPILFLQPTLEMAETYSKDRFDPMVRDTPVLSDKVLAKKSRDKNNTILHKTFAGGQLTFAGANSPASLASRPVRFVLCDEIDRYPVSAKDEGDPVLLARKRTTTFWNWLLVCVSTPTVKGVSRIEKLWEASDKRRYFVDCPHCNHPQHFVWERIEYSNKGTNDADPHSGVYYICEKCGTPIEEKHKIQMVKNGQWQCTAVSGNKIVGFHLNELYSFWRRWVDVALDYESARKDEAMYRVWVNTSLGLPYEAIAAEKLDWERLRDRSSDYQQQTVPMGGLILTAGVDVQADRLEVGIWAWGRGEQAWLIRYEVIFGSPLEDGVWEQLAAITNKTYEHESGAEIRIRATCIDSGYQTQEVYLQVQKYRFLHWFAIKGVSGDGKPIVSPPSLQEINYRGEKIKRGIHLYKVGVDSAKETLYARSQIETPGSKYLNFPQDLLNSWFQGFCSEIQVTKHKDGRPYMVWEKIAGVRNEPLDTTVYALAAAHLVGMTRLSWGQIEKELASRLRSMPTVSNEKIAINSKQTDKNVRTNSEQINRNVRSRTRQRR
jgi:phage terminase large subunit GpA-like protein